MPPFLRAALLALICLCAQPQTMQAPDITRTPTLYVVPYAHLDTQWRWEYPQTISEYLLKTMRVNFDYIDKYPHYVFNWSGANRYRLMKEYFPDDYARVRKYVAAGNWYPAGSSIEEGDVNMPSAESIIRQVLYGNAYFRAEFGKASAEYMLPDCFGFPASLPTILAHAGVKGFSTQKLGVAWQPAPRVGGPNSPEQTPEGIPFNVGLWQGPDGSSVIAALNPGGYGSGIRSDLTQSPPPAPPPEPGVRRRPPQTDWVKRIDIDGKATGVFADYHYIGTGDIGGAVDEQSVKLLEAAATKGAGPLRVLSAAADQLFLDIKPEMTSRLPRYQGDLELINHSAGSLTSQAYQKRWNRKGEILADAAEKAALAADWLGALPYPRQRLNDAWTLLLSGQFHDTAAGTSTPRAYEFAHNDAVIALNQFAAVLTAATRAVASMLDTQAKGTPVVVFNPLNIAREDLVEAAVSFPAGTPRAVRVTGPDLRQVPAQLDNGKVLFLAKAPPAGYAVYDVQPATEPLKSSLRVTESSLENARYRVRLDGNGDVASVFDKALNRELLSAPLRLAISNDAPRQWPAWNMDFDQEQAPPRAYVAGPATIRIVENGAARVAVEIARAAEGSKFIQQVRLAAGDAGNRVEFSNLVEWRSLSANLKAVFALAPANRVATYNWDIGTLERPTAEERQFEVASHQWIDLTDAGGAFGATLLTDVKNGSDKRDDRTIRLTLIRTPGPPPGAARRAYSDQFNQDWGRHEILFGLAGHPGAWQQAQTDWQAYRLDTPLMAFLTRKHAGALGRSFSLVTVDSPRIRMLALKKAEAGGEIILRMVEMDGQAAPRVRVAFAGGITAAREVNGQELPLGPATLAGSALETSFRPYQPRTFALKLGAPKAGARAPSSRAVSLKYDLAAASNDDTKSAPGFDAAGNALPAEMLPAAIAFDGVRFQLAAGNVNAVVARGQTVPLPAGNFNTLYLLAASSAGDQRAAFRVGSRDIELTIQDWGGFVGQWDTRVWKPAPANIRKDWAVSAHHASWDLANRGSRNWSPRYPEDYEGLRPGYIKPAQIAWYASHHHTAEGLNQPYAYSYLFAYALPLPAGARTLRLPANDNIRILAVSVAHQQPELHPAAPLFDTLGRTGPGAVQ